MLTNRASRRSAPHCPPAPAAGLPDSSRPRLAVASLQPASFDCPLLTKFGKKRLIFMRRKNYRPGCAAQADFLLHGAAARPERRKKCEFFFAANPFFFFCVSRLARSRAGPRGVRPARRLRRRGLESPQRTNRQRRARPRRHKFVFGGRGRGGGKKTSGPEPRLRQCGARGGGEGKKGRLSRPGRLSGRRRPGPGLTKKSGASRSRLRQERSRRKTPARPSAPWAPNFESLRPKSWRRKALKCETLMRNA